MSLLSNSKLDLARHLVVCFIVGLLATCTALASTNVGAMKPAARPNILFFLVDDMGWQDCSLAFYHTNGTRVKTALNKLYRTPNLEKLASHGLRFTSASAHTVCSPSRVSLMTGMAPARHKVTNWTYPTVPRQTDNPNPTLNPPTDWRVGGMDTNDVALPGLLKAAGYRTIHSGKAHFGTQNLADGVTPGFGDPRRLGFDVSIAGWGAGGPGSYASENFYGKTPIWHVPGLEQYYEPKQTHTHLTDALTVEINKAISAAVKDKVPFFAYMSHYAIHAPYEIDRRFVTNYPGLSGTTLGHATLIEGMDKSLGDILAHLNELGVAENTLVIFMGDNGAESPNPTAIPNPSAPLRGRKGTPYEGGTRVPLVVAWAAQANNAFQQRLPIPRGGVQQDIVVIEDMFPTLLEFAGVTYTDKVDGFSILPYFRGDSNFHRPQQFVVHMPHDHNDRFYSTLRQGDWKVIYRYLPQSWEMYHLSTDIGESANLAKSLTPENAARLARMSSDLAGELKRFGAQFPTEDATGATRGITMPALEKIQSKPISDGG